MFYDLGRKAKPCAGTQTLFVQERSNLPYGVLMEKLVDLGDDFCVGPAGFPDA